MVKNHLRSLNGWMDKLSFNGFGFCIFLFRIFKFESFYRFFFLKDFYVYFTSKVSFNFISFIYYCRYFIGKIFLTYKLMRGC